MARRESNWSLSIETGIEVKQDSFNKASRIFDAFYNKYNDKSMKINTSDLVETVRDSISAIKQLYSEGTATPTSWLNTRPQMKASFDAILSDAEEMFSGIKVLFNDGSYVSGTENILKGFRNQLSVVFSDIGGLYDELNQKQKDIYVGLNRSAYIDDDSYDRIDILNRINLLNELIEVQKQMRDIHPTIQDSDFAGSLNVDDLKDAATEHKQVLDAMRDYGLETVKQVYQREQILRNVYNEPWNDRSQNIAKEKKNYDQSIQTLEQYIQERRALLTTLDDNDYTLFQSEGVEEYKSEVLRQIGTLEYYKKELEGLKKTAENNTPVGGNLSEVVNQLKEIKEAINAIKLAFEPLTNALSAEDNALHKMLTTSIEDLNALESRLKEVYQMIDTISNKDFNITQQTVYNTRASASMQSTASLGAYKEKAQALLDVIGQLVNVTNQLSYSDGGLFANVVNQLNAEGRMMEFFETLNKFDPASFTGKIEGAETTKDIKNIVGKLTVYKNMLLDVVNIINSVKPGTVDTSFLSTLDVVDEKINKINSGIIDTKNLQTEKLTKTDNVDQKNTAIDLKAEETISKVKTLSEQIETELTSIRAKIETTFDLSTVDLKTEHITAAIEKISQQFTELQNKINALNLNLEVPATVAKLPDGTDGTKEPVTSNIDNGDATTSASQISAEASAMQDVKANAESAAQAKEKFANANKKVATTAQDTSDKVEEEAKKMEEAAGAIVEASNKVDKIKYVEDAGGNPLSKTTTNTETRANAIRTTSTYYTYDDGEPIEQTTTIVDDFKKRAAELKREADKIALAQKTVDKFLSQFESKTAGQASTIKGFDALKNFKIGNLDDIEKATQAMLDLDNEYNKITKSFRQGTKSMNPFVNAVTGINEMENKIKEAEIAFGRLNTKPDELSDEVKALTPLFETMMSFLEPDENGNKVITNIYGMSKAYGDLNSALRQVNSNIKIQKQIDTSKAKDVNFGLDLEKQSGALSKQQAQWKKSGQLTDEVRQKVDGMFDSLSKVTNPAELSAWKKQWSIVKDEVVTTKYETEAAGNASQAQIAAYEQILKSQEKLYNLKKKMVGLDPNSSKGQETMRKITEAQKEYNKALAQGKNLTVGQRTTFKQREAQQKSELSALQQEYKSSVSTKQEKEDLEYILELYAKYTDAAKSIKKMQTSTDATGAVHTAKEAAAIEEVKNAKAELLALGIDVNKISESEVLTEEQKNALLAEQLKYKKQIQNIENTASDKAATNNQKYGKPIYNREAKYFERIDAQTRQLSDDATLSDDFLSKLESYKNAFKELEVLRNRFVNDPQAAKDSALKKQFQDAALSVEQLRKNISETLKEASKFDQISESDAFIGSTEIDGDKFKYAQSAMIDFAATVTDGKLKIEGFNDAGTELYGTLDKGAGKVEKVTVALREGTNQIYAYRSGADKTSSALGNLGASVQQTASRLVTMYLSLYDIIRYVRKGITYVKEIDLAMTELRKVTDETEVTYKNFLKTASSTSAVIGSTVSDFTDATAAFARLGYSIDESSKMAETAIVYKNVAD